jgi:hypothetical protein
MKEIRSQEERYRSNINWLLSDKKISRRQFIKLIPAVVGAVLAYAYHRRSDIRQAAKDILKNYPDVYRFAATAEEHGLNLLDMPVWVNLEAEYKQDETGSITFDQSEIGDISNSQDAVDFLCKHKHIPLEQSAVTDRITGLDFLYVKFPDIISDNPNIRNVIGIDMPTPFGERMSTNHSVALRITLPQNIHATIAPGVPIPNRSVQNEMVDKYQKADYQKLGLPRYLLSQTVISLGHDGTDNQIVPNAERMLLGNLDEFGTDFKEGNITDGTIYLWANGADWGIAEWPDPVLRKKDTGCARLIWNNNPRIPSSADRIFSPFIKDYFSEQYAQLHGYLNHMVVNADYEAVGPTAVFRQDKKTGAKDIVFISPFLPIVAPHIMEELLYGLPVGKSGSKSDKNNLLIAMPDAKYNTMFGYHPGIFTQTSMNLGFYDTNSVEGGNTTDFTSLNNSLVFYLGKD